MSERKTGGFLKLSPKQREVMAYLRSHEELTLGQAVVMIGGDVYTNKAKHVGAVLSNMVKRGLICRVRRGIFAMEMERTGGPMPKP